MLDLARRRTVSIPQPRYDRANFLGVPSRSYTLVEIKGLGHTDNIVKRFPITLKIPVELEGAVNHEQRFARNLLRLR